MKKWSKLIKIAAILALLVLIVMTVVPTFAWLVDTVHTQFRLGADPQPDISLYVGNYDSGSRGYKWSQPLKMENMTVAQSFGTPLQDNIFPQDPTNAAARVNAAMGVIDQLDAGSLDESNYTWFCIRVHEDEGLKFKDIKLEYAQEPFRFFGSDWDAKGNPGRIHHMASSGSAVSDTLQKVFADDRVIPQMMEIAIPTAESKGFITATAPTDGMAMPAVSGPCGHVGRKDNAAAIPTAGTPGVDAPEADKYYTAAAAQVDSNGYYYIYFRMGPNLDAYYHIVDYLFMNMPCYLSFDGMTVSIEVKK